MKYILPSARLQSYDDTLGLKLRVIALVSPPARSQMNSCVSVMLGILPSGTFLPMPLNASGEPETSILVPSGENRAEPTKPSSATIVSALRVARSTVATVNTVVGRFSRREREVLTSIFEPSSAMSSRYVLCEPNVKGRIMPVAMS